MARQKTFADEAKRIRESHKGRENTAETKRTMKKQMDALMLLNDQAIADKEAQEQEMAGDVMRYGGRVQYDKGGALSVNKQNQSSLKSAAAGRGMTLPKYLKELERIAKEQGGDNEFEDGGDLLKYYRTGGDMGYEPTSPDIESSLSEIMGRNSVAPVDPVSNISTDPIDIIPGSEEGVDRRLSTAADVMPYIGDLTMASGKEEINYPDVKVDKISLARQRLLNRKKTDIARKIALTNSRNANTGQLPYLAATGSALQENLMNSDLQSFMAEETANVGSQNRANEINTSTKIKGMVDSQMDEGNRDTLRSQARHGISTAIQTSHKDSNLEAANVFNQRKAMEAINSMFPNYQWGVDKDRDDELTLEWIKSKQ